MKVVTITIDNNKLAKSCYKDLILDNFGITHDHSRYLNITGKDLKITCSLEQFALFIIARDVMRRKGIGSIQNSMADLNMELHDVKATKQEYAAEVCTYE